MSILIEMAQPQDRRQSLRESSVCDEKLQGVCVGSRGGCPLACGDLGFPPDLLNDFSSVFSHWFVHFLWLRICCLLQRSGVWSGPVTRALPGAGRLTLTWRHAA